MNKIHLKDKFIVMLEKASVGFNKEHVHLNSFLKDYEDEEIYLSLGWLPYHKDLLHIIDSGFDFIAASLFINAKNEDNQIEGLDSAIELLLSKWFVLPTTELDNTGSLVSVKGTFGGSFNFYYDDFGAYMCKSFNSLSIILHNLKGVEIKEPEKQYDDLGIEISRPRPKTFTLEDIKFNKEQYLISYKKHLEDFYGNSVHDMEIDIMAMWSRGVPSDELEQMEKEKDQKAKELKEKINTTMTLLDKLL